METSENKQGKEAATIDTSKLDELIKTEHYHSIAMAYVLLRMAGTGQNTELYHQIEEKLYSALDGIPEGKEPEGTEYESDIGPTQRWIALLSGFEAGRRLVINRDGFDIIGVKNFVSALSKSELTFLMSLALEMSQLQRKNPDGEVSVDEAMVNIGETLKGIMAKKKEQAGPADEKQLFENDLKRIRESARCFNARHKEQLLKAALQETSNVTDCADKLIAMESQFRDIIAKLDPKSKAVIGILEELAAVEGCSVDVDYGSKILEELSDADAIQAAFKELSGDPDRDCLLDFYDSATFINSAG